MDKSEDFVVNQIPTLKKLLEAHLFSPPVSQSVANKTSLEVDEFNLIMRQMKYDVQVFENWKRKCSSVHSARDHALLEFKLLRMKKGQDLAENLLSACTRLLTWGDKVEGNIADIMNYRRDYIARQLGLKEEKIPMLMLLNWAAPCLIPAALQEQQKSVLTWGLHDNMQSCAIVIAPVFTYSRGKLHMGEKKMLEQLSEGNHNLDWQFSIVYKEKADDRDMRPMMYPCRMVFPSPLGDPRKNIFFSCELRKNHRTAEVVQVPTKSLKEIQDLSPDALPPTTNERDGHIHGAQKFNQLGTAACDALLSGLLNGVDLPPALLFVDLYPRIGDMLESFLHLRLQHTTCSLFYTALCESQIEATWLHQTMVEMVAEKISKDEMILPGENPEKEMNPDLLEPFPKLPDMNRLIIGGDNKNELQLPIALVRAWQMHPNFGKEFTAWMDEFLLTYKVIDPVEDPQLKRENDGQGVGAAAKKQKTQHVPTFEVMEANAITDALVCECKMANNKDVMLQVRSNHTIYIVNKSETNEWSSTLGFVAGFGKGSFKLIKCEVQESDGISFKVDDDKTMVVFNGAVTELGQVIADQRVKKPDCQVCYHTIAYSDAEPKKFNLKQSHKVSFFPKESDETINEHNIGKKEKLEIWNSDKLAVMWVVRWTTKGLMCVKPVVHLKGSVTLPPGRACKCA